MCYVRIYTKVQIAGYVLHRRVLEVINKLWERGSRRQALYCPPPPTPPPHPQSTVRNTFVDRLTDVSFYLWPTERYFRPNFDIILSVRKRLDTNENSQSYPPNLSVNWCSKLAGITYRNFFVFLNFIPALVNIYYIHLSSSIFLAVYPCFTFKKYTCTLKFSFRALKIIIIIFYRLGIVICSNSELLPKLRNSSVFGRIAWTGGDHPDASSLPPHHRTALHRKTRTNPCLEPDPNPRSQYPSH
jgi:hypothetical protein